MPRSSFTSSFLRGAAPGLGRLAQAVGGGRDAYQDAYTKEEQAQSRIAQAVASQHANQAKADQDNAETSIIQGRPQVFDRTVSARAGVSIPQVQAYKKFQDTGVMPERELPGPADESGIGPGSAPVLDEAMTSKIGQLIGQLAPALLGNVKDNKPDDLARADQIYGDMGLRDDVLGGRRNAADVGGAQRAIKGGDLFKQSSNGSVIDPFSGEVDQSNPIATATVDLKKAQKVKAERVPAPKAGTKEIDRERAAILAQELHNTREAMKTATGPALARLQGDEAAVVSELKRAGVTDLGQLAVPKPGKGAGAPTEDERKAAGWVAQAQFAFDNMERVLAKDPSASKPNTMAEIAGAVPLVGASAKNALNSASRQEFEQAASSFAEAALRAATGAGVNIEEAKQKIRELTPQWGDKAPVIAQKKAALTVYLDSLKTRAGRALPQPSAPPSENSPVGVTQRNVRVNY